MPETLCGYNLSEVRKSLCAAIERRDRRGAQRWAAELIATPAAVGSLWAAYWVAWSAAVSGPTLPILLRQSWEQIKTAEETHIGATIATGEGPDAGWIAFRNDPGIRTLASEQTARLLDQTRQSPTVWPTKEITLHDIADLRARPAPAAADGPVVLKVWRREEDSLELRQMGGHWLEALVRGDLRMALAVVAWSLMPSASQGLPLPLKCAQRGSITLTIKVRASPLWFWLELGKALLVHRVHTEGLHRGWTTMCDAVHHAFREHYKKWTVVERMRVLLAWIVQLRASYAAANETMWIVPPVNQSLSIIDQPFREIAADLANPQTAVERKAPKAENVKQSALEQLEAKMMAADEAIMSVMGLGES